MRNGERYVCTFCGDIALADYGVSRPIAACPVCAVEHLPGLIAVAVSLGKRDPRADAVAALKRVNEQFWHAIEARLLRGAQKDPQCKGITK